MSFCSPSATSLPFTYVLWNLLFSSLTLHAATAPSHSLTGTRSGKSFFLSSLVLSFCDVACWWRRQVFFFFFSHVLIKFVSCSLSLCVIREKYTLEQDIREAEEAIRHKTTEVQVWWNVEMYKADECCDAGSFLPPAQLTGTINHTYRFHFFLASLEVYHQFEGFSTLLLLFEKFINFVFKI